MISPFLLTINLFGSFILPEHPNLSANHAPAWVKNISPADTLVIDSSQREVQYLLWDNQINIDSAEKYTHTISKVLDEGVENSSVVEIEFDPSYESVILHQLAVYRKGEKIEALLPNNARILQRERSLERHIYSGSLSLVIFLSDIKSGDIIDLAYTKKGANPVFAGHYFLNTLLSFKEKIEKLHYRFIRNKDKTLYFKIDSLSPIEEHVLDDSSVETSILISPTRIVENYDVPYWHIPMEWLQVSDFQSWKEVSEWGSPLFYPDTTTAAEKVRIIIHDWIQEGKTSKKELILAALKYVQNEVRYLGVEEGIYSHRPHPPLETLERRYGDCKDKTLLLKVFMDEIGIDSAPSLVNTDYRDRIHDWLPSAGIFDHVILKVSLDGETYWLDPTQKHQGGALSDQSQDFYGSYLVLDGQKESFINISPIHQEQQLDVYTHYKIFPDQHEIAIKRVYKGGQANFFRHRLAYYGKEKISETFKDYLAAIYGPLEIKEAINIEDNLKENEITLKESFILDNLLDDEKKFSLLTMYIPDNLPEAVPASRKAPLSLSYPLEIKETIRISSDVPIEKNNIKKSLEHPSLVFNFEKNNEKEDLVISFFYKTKSNHIVPEDFKSLKTILSKIKDELFLTYQFPSNIQENDREAKDLFALLFAIISISALVYNFYLKIK